MSAQGTPQVEKFIEKGNHFAIRHPTERLAIIQRMPESSRARFGEMTVPGNSGKANSRKCRQRVHSQANENFGYGLA